MQYKSKILANGLILATLLSTNCYSQNYSNQKISKLEQFAFFGLGCAGLSIGLFHGVLFAREVILFFKKNKISPSVQDEQPL